MRAGACVINGRNEQSFVESNFTAFFAFGLRGVSGDDGMPRTNADLG